MSLSSLPWINRTGLFTSPIIVSVCSGYFRLHPGAHGYACAAVAERLVQGKPSTSTRGLTSRANALADASAGEQREITIGFGRVSGAIPSHAAPVPARQ